jgi:integrase/recombinase XerC
MKEPALTQTANLPTSIDLGALYSDYLRTLGRKSSRTIDTYRKAIRQFFAFCSVHGIGFPTASDIEDYLNGLKAQGKTASTISVYLTAVRTFFKWGSRRGILPDVTEGIETPETDRGTHTKGYLQDSEETEILTLAQNSPRDFALLFLMLTTGLRTTEIVNANVEDLREVNGETRLYILGKGRTAKTDYVKIGTEALSLLKGILGGRISGPLFLSESNRNLTDCLTTRSVSRIVKGYLLRIGKGDGYTAHSLRHTTAVQILKTGGSIEEVREVLRHRDVRTTEIYSHDLQRERNRSEQRLSSILMSSLSRRVA